MENKINIAELLRDCPQGTELDCTMYDTKVFYQGLNKRIPTHPITVQTEHGFEFELTQYGQIYNIIGSKCVIFPKGKTTWEGFVPHCKFKDGDVITMENACGVHIFIYNYTTDEDGSYGYYVILTSVGNFKINGVCSGRTYRLALKEEKQKLFQAINDNGYKWNEETKTLEKLPKFKVGDKIKEKEKTGIWANTRTIRDYVKGIGYYTTMNDCVRIDDQDNWELVIEKPIFKVGDKIRDTRNNSEGVIQKLTDEGYECHFEYGNFLISFKEQHYFILVLDKFDITTLKPFESRVLVRDSDTDKWKSNFWGFYDIDNEMNYPYECCGNSFAQCIPYKGNEYLIGTADSCNDYYKTWKK